HNEAAPIARMRPALGIPSALKAVDDASDRAGGESGFAGELTGRGFAEYSEQAEHPALRGIHPRLARERLVEGDDSGRQLPVQSVGLPHAISVAFGPIRRAQSDLSV